MAPEDTAETQPIVMSTMGIEQITQDKSAGSKLKGKKYDKAIKKVAADAVAYLAATGDGDTAERVIRTVLMARAIDEAGDDEAASAYLDLAFAIYRNGWTSAGMGPWSSTARTTGQSP